MHFLIFFLITASVYVKLYLFCGCVCVFSSFFKIDPNVLLLMNDDQLTEYLPSYGDRLAVLGYCRLKGKNPVARKSNRILLQSFSLNICTFMTKS
jgi:hypothetical protein